MVRHALAREPEPAGGRALTGDELSAMLSDLGVSAEAASAAMSTAGAGAPSEEGGDGGDDWLGGPKRIVLEGEVDGELSDDRREDVVEVIREILGDAGRVEALGRTVTWAPTPSVNNQQRRLSVKVRVRDGRTRIRIDEDLRQVRIGSWVGFGMGGGLGLGTLAIAAGKATKSGLVAVGVWAMILAASFLLAWITTRAVSTRRKRELRRLFTKVREEVVRGVAPRARVAPPAAPESTSRVAAASGRRDGPEARDGLAETEAEALEEAAAGGAAPLKNTL